MCPWSEWQASGLYFCEQALCGWVKQPGNTFSNVFYLSAAGWIYWRWRRQQRAVGYHFPALLVALAFGSAFFHSSLAFVGEVADLGSMFFILGLFAVWNLQRYLARPLKRPALVFALVAGIPILAMLAFGSVGVPLFTLLVVLLIASEVWLQRIGRGGASAKLALAGGLLGIAYGLWWLDVSSTWCDPTNHLLSGHVIWHALTALAFVPLADFYGEVLMKSDIPR